MRSAVSSLASCSDDIDLCFLVDGSVFSGAIGSNRFIVFVVVACRSGHIGTAVETIANREKMRCFAEKSARKRHL